MKIKIYLFLLLFAVSCTTEINEPVTAKKFEYNISKPEAELQAKILLDETLSVLAETIQKKRTTTKKQYELLKLNNSDNSYYANGWFVWKNVIKTKAFSDSTEYIADYTSKIHFNNPGKSVSSDTTLSEFNVHTKFGFSKSLYGDEVKFDVRTFLLHGNVTDVEVNAMYYRHWVAIYDGKDSDLNYSVNIQSDNLIYKSVNSLNWFEGKINIIFNTYKVTALLSKNSTAKFYLYKSGALLKVYNAELSSLKLLNGLSKQNNDFYPGYTSIKRDFIGLIINFPTTIQEETLTEND